MTLPCSLSSTRSNFDRAIRTNIRGTFLGMKYQIAAMLHGPGGRS
ncbi:hypothetical protein OG500_36735 [Kitasatospora sp. NBC_01250]|nr:hypothetical protein [Kitasatospora sp. NBC_01250]